MTSLALPAALMIASGSIHAVVNAIVKGPRGADGADPLGARMAARASTDGASAVILLPAALFVLSLGPTAPLAALRETGAMTALYTVADAHGVRAAPSPLSYIVWDFVQIGTESVAMFALLTKGRVFADWRAQWRPGVVAGTLSILTYGLALFALSLGPTAPLAALRETGMVTALILAALFLGEPVTPRRALAVGGILGGAALILVG